MKKIVCLLFALVCLLPLAARAGEEQPQWDYPISPLILRDPDSFLTLANRDNLLDAAYAPQDLVKVSVKSVDSGFKLRRAANEALSSMFAAAKADGYTLYVKSAYRSYQTQKTMYNNRLEKNHGKDDGWVSAPGASDHQTGLGADILNYAWTQKDGMNADFAHTAEAQWMAAHCHEYGFVIRYGADKVAVTGINYEPWHLRYVGLECAAYMHENNLSLEEFTEEWQSYIQAYSARGGNFTALCRAMVSLPAPAETGERDASGDAEKSFFH